MTLPDKPLLTPPALRFLRDILTPDARVFEWGAGGSTVWLAKRVAELVSVEHDADWLMVVVEALRGQGLDVHVWLLPPARFTAPIQSYPDGYWDVALVDGLDRTRHDCVTVARDRVRDGGWLVLDDSQWHMLKPAVELMGDWRRRDVRGRMTHGPQPGHEKITTFWQKGGDDG